MSQATDTYVLLRAFVDELVRSGMRAACTSPGSRSAPLALTLAREPRLQCFSHVDERSSGFFALGLAKASGLPVAVTCTSGTAAAELLPAAIEAHEARVPLLLLTADRPPELRENGAGQAIDQLKLYGGAAKWFFEVGTHEATPERLRWIRTLACRAYATALEGRPGAVHLNFPLREPLVTDEPLPDDDSARAEGAPYRAQALARCRVRSRERSKSWPERLGGGAQRGVIVAGRDERDPQASSLGRAAAQLASAAGWPLLADPLSDARRPGAIAHYDALLRDERFAASMRPDFVLRVGDLPVSKPLREWLAGLGDVSQVALDARERVAGSSRRRRLLARRRSARDPDKRSPSARRVAPSRATGSNAGAAIDELAGEAILGVLGGDTLERAARRARARRAAAGGGDAVRLLLDAGARHRDLLAGPRRPAARAVQSRRQRHRRRRLLRARRRCNRRSAIRRRAGGPVVLLIGDVALAHDLGGLLAAQAPGVEADDRAAEQRRRWHLRLPARRREPPGACASNRRMRQAT